MLSVMLSHPSLLMTHDGCTMPLYLLFAFCKTHPSTNWGIHRGTGWECDAEIIQGFIFKGRCVNIMNGSYQDRTQLYKLREYLDPSQKTESQANWTNNALYIRSCRADIQLARIKTAQITSQCISGKFRARLLHLTSVGSSRLLQRCRTCSQPVCPVG